MPPVLVYDVDFTSGSLQPTVDSEEWGNMLFGGSTAGAYHDFVDGGLLLTATRSNILEGGVSSAVYVVLPTPDPSPPNLALSRASRLKLHVEFDLPHATPSDAPPPGHMLARATHGISTGLPKPPQPWAVSLRVKLGDETDVLGEALMNVTCQFHDTGVRLNDPSKAQDAPSNKSLDLDSPLDYDSWGLTQFHLGFMYSGIQAGPAPATPHQRGDDLGYAVGCGFLEMKPFDNPRFAKYDQRLFSSTQLSKSNQTWIGALGVGVGTVNFEGTMKARLKRFSVYEWPNQ